MITRRLFAGSASAAIIGLGLGPVLSRADAATSGAEAFDAALRQIEADSGGRLGVALLNAATGQRSGYRANELFPLCSTFKLLAAAAMLKKVDDGQASLAQKLPFGRADLVANSPITSARVDEGAMTLADICEAAMMVSDNTAGNLILTQLGGPAGLTSFARAIGDRVTRLDRIEPDLNEAADGDPRDTTSPNAMLADLQSLLFGEALSVTSRKQLQDWMRANRTSRVKAGVPTDWRVADKTGNGDNGTTNDVGALWPADGKPLVFAVYLTKANGAAEARNAILAQVARVLVGTRA